MKIKAFNGKMIDAVFNDGYLLAHRYMLAWKVIGIKKDPHDKLWHVTFQDPERETYQPYLRVPEKTAKEIFAALV